MRKLLSIVLLSACLFLPLSAKAATGYTTVISTLTTDASGNPLASGTATFSVLDANGNPLTVKLVNGGQITLAPVSVPVVDGTFTAQVVDVSQVQPSFPCVSLTIVDNSTGNTVWSNRCLQPTGSTYSLDEFSTNTTPVAPQAGDTVAGNLGVNGNLNVTGTLTVAGFSPQILSADVTNGVYNASLYAGSDILAQAQAAFAACSSDCTVFIPAGTYSASTTLTMPNSQNVNWLKCDPAAKINYTGTANAIETPTITGGSNHLDGIEGCWITGTAAAQNGIHVNVINHFVIEKTKVSGFTNAASNSVGNGIFVQGGNSIVIDKVSTFDNDNGIAGTEITSYASIAVKITGSDLSNNDGWGIITFDSHVNATQENSWLIEGDVFEGNGGGGIDLEHSNSSSVIHNHFEQTQYSVRLNDGYNGVDNEVIGNYFLHGPGTSAIYVVNGFHTLIRDNYEDPSDVGACFIQAGTTGSIDQQNNQVSSTNPLCWPSQSAGWSSSFEPTYDIGTITNVSGNPVAFPNGVSSPGAITGATVSSSTGKITSAACFEANGSGSLICSGSIPASGNPTTATNPESCTIGGSLYLNVSANTGTYPAYVCNNGGWQGLGTVR